MQHFLPTRPRSLSALLGLLLALLVRPVLASHLLAGELTYRYLDDNGPAVAPYRYELTLTIYNNCYAPSSPIAPATSAAIAIYDQATGAKINITATNSTQVNATASPNNLYIVKTTPNSATYSETACIDPTTAATGCNVGISTPQPYIKQQFVGVVALPSASQGYYAVYTQSARSTGIANLNNPSSYSLQLTTAMAKPTIPNRSPVFSSIAVAVICADTTLYLASATDADGDRLEYAFGAPYSGGLPATFNGTTTTVPYASGFTASTPFGTGPGIINLLNSNTGIATFATPNVGRYQVCIDVSEYRVINGVDTKIGTTRRDVVLVVGTCAATPKPKVPTAINTTLRNATIVAGTTATIPITATQSGGNPLKLSLYSELLDGQGGAYDASFNGNQGTPFGNGLGTVTVRGSNGSVSGNFVFNATCAQARSTPYDILITVADTGCGGKIANDVAHITVVKPSPATAITGPAFACGTNSTATYTAAGGSSAPGVGYSWSVTNGTIVGSATANPVTVRWGSLGTGTITVIGTTPGGCVSDPFSRTIQIQAVPGLTFTGPLNVCAGGSTTITANGGAAGATYTITGGPATGTGPSFTLTPTTTTTYTVASTGTATSCPASQTVTITVNPLPSANVAGSTLTVVGGQSIQLGAAPVANYVYNWTPTTGLDNPASSNPQLTLTNYTGAPYTTTYTLNVTNSVTSCQNKATVDVTVLVDPTLEIMNIVLPNGSVRNQVLYIKNVKSFPGATLEIYNRWGRQVFATVNYDNDTNHWGNEPETAPGLYYYLFKQTNGKTTKGWVEVVK